MDEAESVVLKVALDTLLGMYDEKHRFTAGDIQRMHKIWLGGIYEWAGEYRQVNSKRQVKCTPQNFMLAMRSRSTC